MKLTLKKKSNYIWELPKNGDMLVPGLVYGNKAIVDHLLADVKEGKEWNALRQIYNVACLPGLQKASLAMPDVHPGYGFCIGGVGAFDTKEGIITVAGVGFDAGCGVRDIATPLKRKDVEPKKKQLAERMFKDIPAGLGIRGKIAISWDQLEEVLTKGAAFPISLGYGKKEDLKFIEQQGKIPGADPENVSETAKKRESKQIGTLGSGNHYMEIQYVDEIFDPVAAKAYGLEKDSVIISMHCGSRALGHQIGTDYLKVLDAASKKYKIPIRERELVCAPFQSEEGQQYFSAVNCALNYGHANRQVLAHLIRGVFTKVFGIDYDSMKMIYEISHNSAKLEKHKVDGKTKELIVHRKGATRAFGPGHPELPAPIKKVGQPVLVGGTMGTCSYILAGTEIAMRDTFGSACHGAGRRMSRHQAKREFRAQELVRKLEKEGIIVKGHGWGGIAEEAPGAYKDVENTIKVMHETGIATKVARMKPMVCIKG